MFILGVNLSDWYLIGKFVFHTGNSYCETGSGSVFPPSVVALLSGKCPLSSTEFIIFFSTFLNNKSKTTTFPN